MATSHSLSRSTIIFAATLVLALTLSAEDTRQIFLSESQGQWCGYSTAKELEAAPRDQDPEYVATIASRDNKLTAIRLRRSTEDTATYDEYTVSPNGSLSKLTRTFDAIPDRLTRIQVWDLGKTPPAKVSEMWKEFKTGRPVVPDHRLDDYIDHAIMTRLDEFPFAALMLDTRRWLESKRCVLGDAGKLEAPMSR